MSCCFIVGYNVVRNNVIAGGDVDPFRRFVSVPVTVSFCPPKGDMVINAFETSITALISRSKGCPKMTSQSSSATIRNAASYSCDSILIFVLT